MASVIGFPVAIFGSKFPPSYFIQLDSLTWTQLKWLDENLLWELVRTVDSPSMKVLFLSYNFNSLLFLHVFSIFHQLFCRFHRLEAAWLLTADITVNFVLQTAGLWRVSHTSHQKIVHPCYKPWFIMACFMQYIKQKHKQITFCLVLCMI